MKVFNFSTFFLLKKGLIEGEIVYSKSERDDF